jgi:hypothetical protein
LNYDLPIRGDFPPRALTFDDAIMPSPAFNIPLSASLTLRRKPGKAEGDEQDFP